MVIRQEKPEDYDEVYELVKHAFAAVPYSDGTEQDYLAGIRKKNVFVPELSFVAAEKDTIVGQIVLYETEITCKDKPLTQLVVSPLSVLPAYFRQGIGSKLVSAGCERARELGYKAVFLCGDFAFYSRFGFVPSCRYGIYHVNDENKNAEWCMAKELEKGFLKNIKGTVAIE